MFVSFKNPTKLQNKQNPIEELRLFLRTAYNNTELLKSITRHETSYAAPL